MNKLPTVIITLAIIIATAHAQCAASMDGDEIFYVESQNNVPFVSGEFSVGVFLTSLSTTMDEERYRVPYKESETPNFYPEELNGNVYGPELPDPRFDPIDRVSGYFNLLTSGRIKFDGHYHRIESNASTDCVNTILERLGNDVLRTSTENAETCYTNYDVSVVVLPELEAPCPQGPAVFGHRIIVLNGYHNLRRSDDSNEIPGLLSAFGNMFGFPESHFYELDGTLASTNGDWSDIMGVGEQTLPFTNPINHLRAGWLTMGEDIIEVRRSGVYRIWPLYPYTYDKDYAFDLYPYHTLSTTEGPPYQRLRGLVLDPPQDLDGMDLADPTVAWLRTERTYKDESDGTDFRVVLDFGRALMLHKFTDTTAILNDEDATGWLYPESGMVVELTDEVRSSSVLRVNDTYRETDAPCTLSVLCYDHTTIPPSILAEANCEIASPFVIEDLGRLHLADAYTIQDSQVSYLAIVTESEIMGERLSTEPLGYVGFALEDTQCQGASDIKFEILPTATATIGGVFYYVITDVDIYEFFEPFTPIVPCFAEYSTGGIDDRYFVEQIQSTTLQLEYEAIVFYETCTQNCVSCGFDCDIGAGDGYFCSEDSCECTDSPGTGQEPAANVCCHERGMITVCDNTGCYCTCDDGFDGRFCNEVTGNGLEISAIYPVEKYEDDFFFLHVLLALDVEGENLTLSCSAILPGGGTELVSTHLFPEGSNGENLYDNQVISTGVTGWAPGVNISCVFTDITAASNYFGATGENIYVPILAIRPITAPESLRVVEYGEEGDLVFSWDLMDGARAIRDLEYRLMYLSGYWESTDSDYDVVTNPLGFTQITYDGNATLSDVISGLDIGDVYTIRIASFSPTHGMGTSAPIYIIPVNFTDTCSTNQYDVCPGLNSTGHGTACSGNGRCEDGHCWCEGTYHGADCSINGCFASATGFECSGHGNCTGSDEASQCSCLEGYYGVFCEKYSWMYHSISFSNPASETDIYFVGETEEITWNRLDGSLSDDVEFYIAWSNGPAELGVELDLAFAGIYSYDSNGEGKYTFNVPELLEEGEFGVVKILVKDRTHFGIVGSAEIRYTNPPPFTEITGDSGDDGTGDTGEPPSEGLDPAGVVSLLTSDEYVIYTALGGVAVFLSLVCLCCFCFVKTAKRDKVEFSSEEELSELSIDN